jgi:hypothetical protein
MMRLYSRRDHDWTKRLARLVDVLRAIPAHQAVCRDPLNKTGAITAKR